MIDLLQYIDELKKIKKLVEDQKPRYLITDTINDYITAKEKEVQSTLGELLAIGIRDDYGLPTQIKNWKIDSRGTENMLADKFVKLAARVQQLTQDERAVLMNMIEGNIVYKQVPGKTRRYRVWVNVIAAPSINCCSELRCECFCLHASGQTLH